MKSTLGLNDHEERVIAYMYSMRRILAQAWWLFSCAMIYLDIVGTLLTRFVICIKKLSFIHLAEVCRPIIGIYIKSPNRYMYFVVM